MDYLPYSLLTALDNVTRSVSDWLGEHAVNIIVILVGAWLFRHFGARVMNQVLAHTVRADLYPTKSDRIKRLKTLRSLTGAIIRTGVYVIAGILIIGELNPSYTTALFASAGLVTVALGFGARDLINDFMSGIFIITENQYRVGDTVDLAGVSGTVEDVTIRTTVLRDAEGNVHHVPNGDITVTTNRTLGFSRLNEEITVPPDNDLERIEHIINHVGEELAARTDLKHKIHTAPHVTQINGIRDGNVILTVAGTVSANDKPLIRSEFYRGLHAALKRQDIKLSAASVPAGTKK